MLMLDCSCEELISLSELAELVFGNGQRTDLAAQRCHQDRIRIVQHYRGRVGETALVLYIKAEDVPRFLGSNHPLMRSPYGWRLALDHERRHKTRALKRQAAQSWREARLGLHLEQQALEVEAELSKSRSSWQTATSRR
jgi:hypothetical protein